MKNFMMSGSSHRSKRRSIFMRMLMGIGALATTYIIMPRAKRAVNNMVNRGIEGSDSLVKKGRETLDNMMGRDPVEKKSPDELESEDVALDYHEEQSQILDQISQLQKAIGDLEGQLQELRQR